MRPLIGITTYVEPASWGLAADAALIPYDYVRSVEAAGGRALLVPPSDGRDRGDARRARRARPLRRRRLDPDRTAPTRTRRRAGRSPERDAAELALLQAALARDMPVLAVCRGFQIMNVARGGDLVQHLPEVVGHEQHRAVKGVFSDHEVSIDDDPRSARCSTAARR